MAKKRRKTDVVPTQKEAAERLGITARALREWQQEPGFPDRTSGYEIQTIVAWRDARGRKGSDHGEASRSVKLQREEEKLKRDRIQTERDSLALREKQGELLPRRAWELFAATLLTTLGDWCEQLPQIIGPSCPTRHRKKVVDRLKRELDKKRSELKHELERKARELES